MSTQKNRHVALLNTGGTIGMRQTSGGYMPAAEVLDSFIQAMPQLAHPDVPTFDLHHLSPLLDSANMRPEDWGRIVERIVELYDRYDGFVLLHGTDTMTYTASALSFMLQGLEKPVILTGAQLSLNHVRSDGREHLVTSLILAADPRLSEVGIYSNSQLLRGNRAQKVSAERFRAFESGNLRPLVQVGASIHVAERLILSASGPLTPLTLQRSPEVVSLRLYPGITAATLRRVIAEPTEAVVLETYGSGNFPSLDPALLQVISEAIERGVLIVNCSQCLSGAVRQTTYSTGMALAKLGVISGHDMTPEAALAKLYCLLAAGWSAPDVQSALTRALAGEMTLPRI